VQGWDFVANDSRPLDLPSLKPRYNMHGTSVAGIIAGGLISDNSAIQGRTLGIAPNAKIMPIRVLSEFDFDSTESNARIAAGIRYAAQNGADVINMSLGYDFGTVGFSEIDSQIEQALHAIRDLGIAVGAIDRKGRIADFSNPAGNAILDYVVAPGVDIFTTGDFLSSSDAYLWRQGTSFAAPYVAGIVALMLSANPNLTPAQVEEILTSTANSRGVTGV
jgi:subtilisin family serine protease